MKQFFLLAVIATAMHAQTPSVAPQAAPAAPAIDDLETTNNRWDCSLPGGNFTVAVGSFISTSIHQFVVPMPTSTASPAPLPTRVHEVNIATNGSLSVRFYYVEVATAGSGLNVAKTALDAVNAVGTEAANRTGTLKTWQMVQKDYPHATHAHTVEFRVDSLEQLNRLYGSVKRSWINGKGALFSIR